MALTKSDKKWIANTIKRVLTEVITALPEDVQMTSYDGATEIVEDYYGEEGTKRRKRPRIGF